MSRARTASRWASRACASHGPSSTKTPTTRTQKSWRHGSRGAGPASVSSEFIRAGSTSEAIPWSSSIACSWSASGGWPGVTPVLSDAQRLLLSTVGRLMDRFGPDYWRDLDEHEAYPEAFVSEFEAQGFGALLIPEAYGGTGGSLTDAALVLEEIHARGGNAQPFHGQYYLSFLMNRLASEDLRRTYLPALARGELRMQSFALTEPDAGSDLTRITTTSNSQTYELFLNDVEVPVGHRFGEENRGFEYLLHVLNPERILLASECIGDSRWFID